MADYKIPDEIRAHNRILHGIRPFSAEGTAREVLEEYESIILIQRRGIEQLKEERSLRRGLSRQEPTLIGQSFAIRRIRDLTFRIQNSDAPVLIQAETGCGKELIASEVQRRSRRWEKPFLKVNCSAFPESLFESELFGYEEGAFTGARRKGKQGIFVAADGGTIFLDEIGELPLNMQAKLLRVLQEGEVTPVGSVNSIRVDVRIIAATNQNLQTLVRQGLFRKDLYYRLNVLPIFISPLRERKEDIPLLAQHFLAKYSRIYDVPKDLTPDALEALQTYDWPGNVRELENIMERLVAWGTSEHIGRGDILMVTHFENEDPLVWYEPQSLTLKEKLALVERQEIMAAMERCGTTRKAAQLLGITQSTLVRRIAEYQIYIES